MRWVPLIVAVLLALGCGADRTPAAAAPPKPPPKLYEGPLTDYVPAGGVNWLLLGKPNALSTDRALVAKLQPLISSERLDIYAKHSGIELRELTSAAVVGFDLGTLYLAETDRNLTLATQVFAERLQSGADVRDPHPQLTRITGVVGRTPQSLLWQEGKLLAVAVGDTSTTRIVEAFARNKLKRTKRLFEGAALREFREFGGDAPLVFLAPGPFEGRWMYGANGLLAGATAVGIRASPVGSESLAVQLTIAGPWQDTPQAVSHLRAAWQDLAESSTGRLFGLHEPLSPPTLEVDSERLSLRVSLSLDPIIHGLRAAVIADVWEMLDLPHAPAPPGPTKGEQPTPP